MANSTGNTNASARPHQQSRRFRQTCDGRGLTKTLADPTRCAVFERFARSPGQRFTFRTTPMGDWDGVAHCEVLDREPPRLLRYSWKGGADTNPAYGSRLDSTVTWTLMPVEGGTHLRLVHDGFVFPGNRFAYDMMKPGWGKVMDSIARVTAER
jgi:uncharacterized protein YndB with AHSA1/START domain